MRRNLAAVAAGLMVLLPVEPASAHPSPTFEMSPTEGPRGTVIKFSGICRDHDGMPYEHVDVRFEGDYEPYTPSPGYDDTPEYTPPPEEGFIYQPVTPPPVTNPEVGLGDGRAPQPRYVITRKYRIDPDGTWEGDLIVPPDIPLGIFTVQATCILGDHRDWTGLRSFTVLPDPPVTTTTTGATTTTTAPRPRKRVTTTTPAPPAPAVTTTLPPPTGDPDNEELAAVLTSRSTRRPTALSGAAALALLMVSGNVLRILYRRYAQ